MKQLFDDELPKTRVKAPKRKQSIFFKTETTYKKLETDVQKAKLTIKKESRAYCLLNSYDVIDEAHFWLNGYVNKQNCRIWSEANPQVHVETQLHPEKLTVWFALWAGGILLQKRRRPQRYSQW
ncbi:hypothetical protein TNCV_561551 [Trichonephila clavipes]|uniref:Uncharacterized protein n=1 Tax=Trichonephila clavipes TaxID=2585209 RepID=A0A8X6S5A4_TRICX|nr:hypothetical protein TNCV_561551 [Trichonephila clavipes]